MLHLSKTQYSTMSSLKSRNFREAVSDLLTVTMHLQNALPRFHRPDLHEVDLRVHVSSAPTCTLSLHDSQRWCAVGAQDNGPRRAIAHLAAWVSRCDTLASSTNQCHQLRLTGAQANLVLFLGGSLHRTPRVFHGTVDPDSDSRVASMVLYASSPISTSHHQDRTLRSACNSRNIEIATHSHVARRMPNQISQQTLDVDFITSGSFAHVSGQVTNCVF